MTEMLHELLWDYYKVWYGCLKVNCLLLTHNWQKEGYEEYSAKYNLAVNGGSSPYKKKTKLVFDKMQNKSATKFYF